MSSTFFFFSPIHFSLLRFPSLLLFFPMFSPSFFSLPPITLLLTLLIYIYIYIFVIKEQDWYNRMAQTFWQHYLLMCLTNICFNLFSLSYINSLYFSLLMELFWSCLVVNLNTTLSTLAVAPHPRPLRFLAMVVREKEQDRKKKQSRNNVTKWIISFTPKTFVQTIIYSHRSSNLLQSFLENGRNQNRSKTWQLDAQDHRNGRQQLGRPEAKTENISLGFLRLLQINHPY